MIFGKFNKTSGSEQGADGAAKDEKNAEKPMPRSQGRKGKKHSRRMSKRS